MEAGNEQKPQNATNEFPAAVSDKDATQTQSGARKEILRREHKCGQRQAYKLQARGHLA